MIHTFINDFNTLESQINRFRLNVSIDQRNTINQAVRIATDSLKSRYSEQGILAGSSHFADVWARDCCFAGFGALSLEDHHIVRRSIKVLLQNMNQEGQVPLRVGQKYFLLRFLHLHHFIPVKEGPVFIEDKYISIPKDSNSLLLILFANYIRQSNDLEFLHEYYDWAFQVFEWNIAQLSNQYLIDEGPYSGWADSLKKTGQVLYTNMLAYQSFESMAYLSKLEDQKSNHQLASSFALKIKAALNSIFWNGEYYWDWIPKDKDPLHHFAIDGNLFSILFGVADSDKTKSIFNKMDSLGVYDDVCVGVHYPDIPSQYAYPVFRLIGLSDYHTQMRWLWLSCVDVVAQIKAKQFDRAQKRLSGIARTICQYNGVFEVYEPGSKPVSRLFYKSESTFSWSAGMFIWAVSMAGLID